MFERRKSQRKNLMAYNQVFDLYGGRLLGYLGDLHLQGAMIIASTPLDENAELTLSVELPDLPNAKTLRMTIPARSVWCQPDISPEFFNIGFEFKNITPEQAALIEAIIDNYEFRRTPAPNVLKPPAET
jgi:hypothetical protein